MATHKPYEELQRENNALKHKNAKLQDEVDILDAIQEKAGILNQTVTQAELPGFVGDIALDLKQLRTDYNALQIENKRTLQWNKELEEANETLQTEVTTARKKLEEKETEISELREADTANDAIWRKTVAKLQSEVDRLTEENKKIYRLSAANHAYQRTIAKLRADKDTLETENTVNSNEADERKVELDSVKADFNTLEGEYARCREDKTRLASDAQTIRESLVIATENYRLKVEEHSLLQTQYAELETKYQALVKEAAQWQPTAITEKEAMIRESLDNATHEGRIHRYALEFALMQLDAETDRVADLRCIVDELKKALKEAEDAKHERTQDVPTQTAK